MKTSLQPKLRQRSFLSLIIAVCLATVLLPASLPAQAQTPSQAEVDSGKAQPLELKPGCWEVSTHQSIAMGGAGVEQQQKSDIEKTVNDIVKSKERAGEPVDRPAIVAQVEALVKQNTEFMSKALKRGGDGLIIACVAIPFADTAVEVYGTPKLPNGQCTRTVEMVGKIRHMHVECNGPPGGGGIANLHISDDFERIDSQNFRGTQRKVETYSDKKDVTTTNQITGKWISEAQPHLPESPAPVDISGKKAVGPKEVAWMDPYRVVADFGVEKYTAQQAYILFNITSTEASNSYGPRLENKARQIYLHGAVANEAFQLKLDLLRPWSDKLSTAIGATSARQVYSQSLQLLRPLGFGSPWDFKQNWSVLYSQAYPIQLTTKNADMASFFSPTYQKVVDILWDAYFSQAGSQSEKKELLRKMEEKYRMTVLDSDFFTDPPKR